MPINFSTSGDITQINMSGEFDFASQDELKEVFTKALHTSQFKIQIDMQKTTFIDSAIIRMLLKFNEMVKQNQKSLQLMNCNERIYEIFTIGGFDQIFDIQ